MFARGRTDGKSGGRSLRAALSLDSAVTCVAAAHDTVDLASPSTEQIVAHPNEKLRRQRSACPDDSVFAPYRVLSHTTCKVPTTAAVFWGEGRCEGFPKASSR